MISDISLSVQLFSQALLGIFPLNQLNNKKIKINVQTMSMHV